MAIVKLLVQSTSFINITGFPQSFNLIPQNLYLRRFFVICTFCLVCGFIAQVVIIFQQYFEYKIDTVVQLRFERLQYPAVTVCNLNGYKKSALSKSPEIGQLMAAYSYVTYKQSQKSQKVNEVSVKETTVAPSRKRRQVDVVDVMEVTHDQCIETSYQSHVHQNDVIQSSYLTCTNSSSFHACISACNSVFCFPGLLFNSVECNLKETVAYVDSVFHSCIYDRVCGPQCQICSQLVYNCHKSLLDCSIKVNDDKPIYACMDVIDSLCQLIEQFCLVTPIPSTTNPPPPPEILVPPIIPPDKLAESLDTLALLNETEYKEVVQEYETAVIQSLPPEFLSLVTDDSDAKNVTETSGENVVTPDEIAIKVAERMKEITAQLSILSPELRKELSYNLDETIISCSVNAKPCLENDWTDTVDPDFGNCFTFNFNQSTPYQATRPGNFYGLRFIIISNTSDYMFSSQQAGAKITIHSAARDPFPSVEGFSVGLGSYNAFAVKYQEISRLPEPFGDCINYKDPESYFYQREYHNEGCFRSCFQDQLMKQCHCADSRFPVGRTKTSICTSTNTTNSQCLAKFIEAFPTTTMKQCQCGMACNEGVYRISKTTTSWPNNENFMARTCSESMLKFYNKTCRKIYQENAIFADVFYNQLNYETVSESPVYSRSQVFNNIVGSAGLFLCLTVPSVVELIMIIIQAFGYVFSIGQLSDVPSAYENDSEEEDDDDDVDNEDNLTESSATHKDIDRTLSSDSLRPYEQDSSYERLHHISPQYPRYALLEDLALRPPSQLLFHRRSRISTSSTSQPEYQPWKRPQPEDDSIQDISFIQDSSSASVPAKIIEPRPINQVPLGSGHPGFKINPSKSSIAEAEEIKHEILLEDVRYKDADEEAFRGVERYTSCSNDRRKIILNRQRRRSGKSCRNPARNRRSRKVERENFEDYGDDNYIPGNVFDEDVERACSNRNITTNTITPRRRAHQTPINSDIAKLRRIT